MSLFDLDNLHDAVHRLMLEIGARVGDEDVSPERLEKLAKCLSIYLKVLHDLEQNNARASQTRKDTHYLDYEDLPPPSPQERGRIIERFDAVVKQLASGTDLPGYCLKAAPK